MKKNNLCHKNAIYYILNNKSLYKEDIFENLYINKVYKNLLKETKKSYKLISLDESLDAINNSLDNKRKLCKEFKSLTNITWML